MYRTENEMKIDIARKLKFLIVLIALLLSVGTLFYHFAEGWSLTDSLYFSTISLTSRGFSDLRPTIWYTVLFTVFYLLIGVAFLIYAISTLISYYTAYYEERVHRLVGKMKNKKKKPDKWVVLKMKR